LWVLLQGSGVLPAAQTAPPRSLIYCGWFGNTIPTPAFVAANKAFLETQPFHGLVAYLRNDSTGFNATTRTMTTTPVSATDLATLLAPMRNATFSVLRENFGLIQGSTPPDFFDDWTVPIQNFATVARALKEAGLKGIVFDNEQYFSPWGNYPDGMNYGRPLAEYQTQARLRGKQVMEAMIAQFPEIAVITLHGPTVSEPKAPWPLFPTWYTGNELLGPFFCGMMEGTTGPAVNIDGGELYHLRSADEFRRSYDWRKFTLPSDAINCAFIPAAMRASWPGKSCPSFGVYDRPFGGAPMDPTILRTTTANALRQTDRFVWFYAEGATYLRSPSQGGASATWVDALRQAVADAGTAPPAVPAAPTNLSSTVLSSTSVDLSWSDGSTNETGFEIERKTGPTGTWARVLTTGANVVTMDDIGLSASTTYVYRLRAVSSAGASAWSNESSVTTAASIPVPSAPSHLAAAATSATGVRVTWWDMSNNETGFEIERKTGSAGAWARVRTTGANTSTVDDAGLAVSMTYFYRVRAVNGTGPSPYSNEVGVTTPAAAAQPPAAPINFLFSSNAHLRISVKWTDASSNETGFEIQRKTGDLGQWSTIGSAGANATVYDDWTVVPGVTYVYRARAVNGAGASAWTNRVTTTAW